MRRRRLTLVRLKPGAAARETAVAPSRFAVINSVISRSSRGSTDASRSVPGHRADPAWSDGSRPSGVPCHD